MVGEYDEAVHLRIGRRARDLAREGRFRAAGLECFTVVGSDLYEPEIVVERMRATRDRALRLDLPARWTIEPPDGGETDLSYGDELRLRAWWHHDAHGGEV